MAQPIIGITTSQGTNEEDLPVASLMRAYIDAIVEAGGIPILIPSNLSKEALLTLCDRVGGVLFSGGGDISIERFGGEFHPSISGVDPERDSLELSMLGNLIERGKPFLGICRGCQVINVRLGGTLYTHISDQMPNSLKHDYYPGYPRTYLAHTVRVDSGTQLVQILGDKELSVNSFHHQGVKDIPEGLKQVAHTSDGLVEALELKDHPFGLAVQWHPEWLTNQETSRRLFRAFVEAAGIQ
jgi:putative glutamine amidotransferase